ncbi:MAG: ABC transporter ATP-binding protein [Gammaproteobacteria bacterium]
MSLLSTHSLSVIIGDKPICKNLDFKLDHGQRWGILGGNGIGKTTMLQTLAGLLPAAGGEISVAGMDLDEWNRKALARKLGVLFQDSQDTFPGSVMETALTGRYPYLPFWAFEGKEDIAMANQALSAVAMQDMVQRQVNTLSGGERRRLAIATLLVQNPVIWLLDEPTNHLDLHHQITLLELIVNRAESVDGGIIMVLHDVNLVSRFCTHAMLMIDHETILCGLVEEIVIQQNLQRLYQHPIRHIHADGAGFFFPE